MDLTGYVFEKLREDERVALYRATMPGDGSTCLVATPTSGKSEATVCARLEHELALADPLDGAWLARPLALARYEGRLAPMLEDPDGKPLDALIGKPFDLAQFLSIDGLLDFDRNARAWRWDTDGIRNKEISLILEPDLRGRSQARP